MFRVICYSEPGEDSGQDARKWWQYLLHLMITPWLCWKVSRACTHTQEGIHVTLTTPGGYPEFTEPHNKQNSYNSGIFFSRFKNQSYTTGSWLAINSACIVVLMNSCRQWYQCVNWGFLNKFLVHNLDPYIPNLLFSYSSCCTLYSNYHELFRC